MKTGDPGRRRQDGLPCEGADRRDQGMGDERTDQRLPSLPLP